MVSGKLASFIGKIENLAKRVFLEKANLSRKNMLIAACKPCKTWSGSTRTLITRLYHVETYSKGFLQLCKGWIGLLKNGGDEISMILIRKNFKNIFKMWYKAETKKRSILMFKKFVCIMRYFPSPEFFEIHFRFRLTSDLKARGKWEVKAVNVWTWWFDERFYIPGRGWGLVKMMVMCRSWGLFDEKHDEWVSVKLTICLLIFWKPMFNYVG